MARMYRDADNGDPVPYELARDELDDMSLTDIIDVFSGNAYDLVDLLNDYMWDEIAMEIKQAALRDEELFCTLLNLEPAGGYR